MADWRTTKQDSELDIRCDLCRKPADTIHWVPWVGGRAPEKVLFACPDHDPGGYWLDLKRWFNPSERLQEHVAKKAKGDIAIALYEARINELRRL